MHFICETHTTTTIPTWGDTEGMGIIHSKRKIGVSHVYFLLFHTFLTYWLAILTGFSHVFR
jgi:hypothetical protein